MNCSDVSTDFTIEHYSRPVVKSIIQSKATAGDAFRCGNGDFNTWYKYDDNNNQQLFNLVNDADYNLLILHHRTLYWSLNFFEHATFQRKQMKPSKGEHVEDKLGKPEETTDYTLSIDIDHVEGTDIHAPEVKKAVEDMGQFYCDELRKYMPTSVYALYSGGGIYVHIHHGLWSEMIQNAKDKDYTQFLFRETFNLWVCAKREEFYLLHPEHVSKCKPDALNNRKRVFKSILSIHKKLPYAVIPLNPQNIKIDFDRAKLPLSDEVLTEARNWYTVYDKFEGECPFIEALKPFTEEAIGKYEKYEVTSEIKDITASPVSREVFPPCIRRILDTESMPTGKTRAIALLAAFLYHAAWKEDDAKALFFAVAHRLHANTSNIFRSYFGRMHCPNCSTIKSDGGGFPYMRMKDLNICNPDSLCKSIKSPAKYILKTNPAKHTKKAKTIVGTEVEIPVVGDYFQSDLGNANRLVDMYGDKLRFCEDLGAWFVWDGKRWEQIKGIGKVMQYARGVVKILWEEAIEEEDKDKRASMLFFALKSQSRSSMTNMVSLASSDLRIAVSPNIFDADIWKFNVQNGIVDLRNGKLLPHDPKAYHSRISPVTFDPDAKCPVWKKFMRRIFQENERILEYCQRRAGYIMTGDTREEDFEQHYGSGSNGKSKYAFGIIYVMGEYHRKANVESIQASSSTLNGSNASPDVVALIGARLVTVSEPDKGTVLNESRVKDWTGRDPITARPLYCKPVTFTPIFKLWIYTNHRIVITSQNKAIWRRVKFLPFEVTIPEEEMDKELDYKIQAEASGILNWMIAGCLKWQKDGLQTPPEMLQAAADYKEEMDAFGEFFNACCIIGKKNEVYAQDLYTVYTAWCSIQDFYPLKPKKFYSAMEERGFKKLPKDKHGIKLQGVTLGDAVKQQLDYAKSDAGKAKGDAVMLVTQFLISFNPYIEQQKSLKNASPSSLRHQIDERIAIFTKKYGIINSNQITSFVHENIKPLFPDHKEEELLDLVSRILHITKNSDQTEKQTAEEQNNVRHPCVTSVTKMDNSVTQKREKRNENESKTKKHPALSKDTKIDASTKQDETSDSIMEIPSDVQVGGEDL